MFDDLPEYNRMIRLSRMEGKIEGIKQGREEGRNEVIKLLSSLLDEDSGLSPVDIRVELRNRLDLLNAK